MHGLGCLRSHMGTDKKCDSLTCSAIQTHLLFSFIAIMFWKSLNIELFMHQCIVCGYFCSQGNHGYKDLDDFPIWSESPWCVTFVMP